MEHKSTPDEARELFSVALLAAEILLSSGAEIHRVEDTISRILSLSGYAERESYVTPTSILMTLRDPTTETITTLKRVTASENNLDRVSMTNTVARSLCAGTMTAKEAASRLAEIRERKGFPRWVGFLTLFLLPVCFYLFFGGTNHAEALITIGCGAWLSVAKTFLIPKEYSLRFFRDVFLAMGVAFLASVAGRFLPGAEDANLVIISSIMPLVPGMAITTAIRDVLHGDYQSGTTRAIEAFLIATAVAVGVGAGLFLFRLIP